MKISHATRIADINTTNGYGYATNRMIDSLERLGHTVKQNDPTAPVEIWFDQPHHIKWSSKDSYKISYLPWESTKLQDGWADMMNTADEVWTPSPLIAKWYAADGVTKPIFVYEHGVDEIWKPKTRLVDEKIRFLHLGFEAARKGGFQTLRAFRKAFPQRDDVELTLKGMERGWKVDRIGKTSIITESLSLDKLVNMFHKHHVFVCPSEGEGFGLPALQSMVTGMPTICTGAWAPYKRFLDPSLTLDSELRTSSWQDVHPGKMFRVDEDELIDKLRWAADNYEDIRSFAQGQVAGIQREYDWLTLTKDTFNSLENRLLK